MKRKLLLGAFAAFALFFCLLGITLLPNTKTTVATAEDKLYTLQFDGAEGRYAHTGAEKTVDVLPGESLVMQFTMVKNLEVTPGFTSHGQGYTFWFHVGSITNGAYSTTGKPRVFTRSGYYGQWFGQGMDGKDKEVSIERLAPAAVFSEGNAVKVVYTPAHDGEDNGSFIIYLKDTFVANSEYREIARNEGLSASVAPSSNVGLFMVGGWKLKMIVKDYSIKTTGGEDLGVGFASGGNMCVGEYKDPTDVYDIKFTANGGASRGYFGMGRSVDLAANEKLVMEYDITDENFDLTSYNMGFTVVSASTLGENAVLSEQSNHFDFAGNHVLSGSEYAFVNGVSSPSGIAALNACDPLTAKLDPYTVFDKFNRVRVVYTPYTSETEKGSILVYVNKIGAPESSYVLASSVTGINESFAPKNNVRLFTQLYKFASWTLNSEYNMQITDYSVYVIGENGNRVLSSEIVSNDLCEVVCTPVKDKTVVEYTVHSFKSGYFGSSETFKRSMGTKFAMEFSVLESKSNVTNCWIGFSYGATTSRYMYYSPEGKGGLMYFNTAARAAGEATLESSDRRSEAFWVFSAGYRVKGELDFTDYKFRVYKKRIGDKDWGEAIAVWKVNPDSLGDSFSIAILVQNDIDITVADLNYTIDGAKKEFTLTGSSYVEVDTSVIDVPDYAAIMTANRKSATEKGSLKYTYEKSVYVTDKVSFRMIKNDGLILKLKGKNNAESYAEFDLTGLNKDFYMVKKSEGYLELYGKNVDEADYSFIKKYDKKSFDDTEYYFSFYIENDTVYAKNAIIDDFIIDGVSGTVVYDFNKGLYECFSAESVGRSLATINYEYFTVTYFYADGTEVSVQKVGYGNAADIPNGTFKNIEEVKAKSAFIDSDIGIMLEKTEDDFDYLTVALTGGKFENGKSSGAFKSGTTVTVTGNITADECDEFIGWFDQNGNNVSKEIVYTFTVTANVSLEAKYSTNLIKLSDGKFESGFNTAYAKKGTVLTVIADERPNVDFEGWYDKNGVCISNDATTTITVTGSATYYVRYVFVKIVGGTLDKGGNSLYTQFDAKLTVKADSNESNVYFDGWYDENGTRISKDATTTITVTGSATYFAKYGTLNVSVDNNYSKITAKDGNVISFNSVKVPSDCTLTVTAKEPEEHKRFIGFYDENGVCVSENPSYTFTVTDSVQLEARYGWVQVLVTAENGLVSDDRFDGANDGKKYVDYYSTVTIIPATIEHKEFLQWSWLDKNGDKQTSKEYRKPITIKPEEPTTYMAEFIYVKYTITVINGTIDGKNSDTIEYLQSATVTANEPADGKIFSCWYVNNKEVGKEATYTFTVSGDTTVVAVYKNTAVTVNVTGGTVLENKDVYYYGDTITLSADNRDGYEFVGWYDGDILKSTEEQYSLTLNGDVTLTAKFEEKTDASYEGCDGAISASNAILSAAVILIAGAVVIVRKRKEEENL